MLPTRPCAVQLFGVPVLSATGWRRPCSPPTRWPTSCSAASRSRCSAAAPPAGGWTWGCWAAGCSSTPSVGGELLTVAASAGVAEHDRDGVGFEALYRAADGALRV